MERVYEIPKIIKDLIEKIDNCSLAIDVFWEKVKEIGTPIIEDYPYDNDYSLVTLLYKEEKSLNNVVLIPPVGMRKLENCIMDKLPNTNVWYISYKVKKNICFTYEFSLNDPLNNDWNRRWKNVQGDIFNKNSIKYFDKENNKQRNIPYAKLENSQNKKYIYKYPNVKEGKLIDNKIYSDILDEERDVTIYIPYGYNNEPCNLLVLNDGNEYINILNIFNILNNLIYLKKSPKLIAVLVKSNKNRAENLKCSDDYAKFLSVELMNFIKDKYNVSNNPKDIAIGGYSLGGLMASYVALKFPSVFNNVLSQSGSYWYKREGYKDNELWIVNEYIHSSKLPIRFYINVGEIEPEISMKNTNKLFADKLKSMKYDVNFKYFGSGHDYLYWDETLAEGIITLFN